MARPPWEVADVLHRYGERYRQSQGSRLGPRQRRVLDAIETCRTATLGGHVEACEQCGVCQISYNSCRNRHCPKCQSRARIRWLEARRADLLPVGYFHVVFTLPQQIAKIGLQNKRRIYNLLFEITAETLRTIAADPKHLGAEIGFLAVLHTWGQTLSFHPHLHCIVPGGGFDLDGSGWISCRPDFFLPVLVLGQYFRRRFLEALQVAYRNGELEFHGSLADLRKPTAFARWLQPTRRRRWVVYAKRPFGGPDKVLEYLGRYTHRVAISNHRLLHVGDGAVSFRWRDYRHGSRKKVMTLDAEEFLRRFLLHVLPDRFVRIRHFGFLANRCRADKLGRARQLLEQQASGLAPCDLDVILPDSSPESTTSLCPDCRQGQLICVEILPPTPQTGRTVEGIDSS